MSDVDRVITIFVLPFLMLLIVVISLRSTGLLEKLRLAIQESELHNATQFKAVKSSVAQLDVRLSVIEHRLSNDPDYDTKD